MVGPFPGWVIIPLPFTLFNWASWWGWAPLLFNMAVAALLRSKGRNLTWAIRRMKSRLRGYRINARSLGYRRLQTTEVPMWEFDFDTWRKI